MVKRWWNHYFRQQFKDKLFAKWFPNKLSIIGFWILLGTYHNDNCKLLKYCVAPTFKLIVKVNICRTVIIHHEEAQHFCEQKKLEGTSRRRNFALRAYRYVTPHCQRQRRGLFAYLLNEIGFILQFSCAPYFFFVSSMWNQASLVQLILSFLVEIHSKFGRNSVKVLSMLFSYF